MLNKASCCCLGKDFPAFTGHGVVDLQLSFYLSSLVSWKENLYPEYQELNDFDS